MEKVLHMNDAVHSVAMSPDEKHITCGLSDGTIQVWDMETGEALCASLQGHTDAVASVAFSLDGHHIISGSYDNTVQLSDVEIGEASGSPL
jgi:WD40 repeat protein